MTTPLFLLRCKQLGLSMTELDLLTIGLINDMFTERENDDYTVWNEVAGQADFDAFLINKCVLATKLITVQKIFFQQLHQESTVLFLHLHNQHQFRLTLGTHCAALSIIVGYNSIPANV